MAASGSQSIPRVPAPRYPTRRADLAEVVERWQSLSSEVKVEVHRLISNGKRVTAGGASGDPA
jgi:hypothetical protein